MNRITLIEAGAHGVGAFLGICLAACLIEVLSRICKTASTIFLTNHENHYSKPIKNAAVLSLKE